MTEAHVLTRPLGASTGDHLSQPTGDGGLGFGTVVTSGLFLVVCLIVSRKDIADPGNTQADHGPCRARRP